MSTTAGRVVERALKRVLVGGADASPEPDEYQDALEDLNNMMLSLEADGVRLGYTAVDNVSDIVTVPPGAILPIINNLAVTVAPDYDASVSPALAEWAREGMQTLLKLGRAKIRMSYPSTLPMGSGNEQTCTTDLHFYGSTLYGLISLAGNTLATDIVLADTPVKVAGQWIRIDAEGIRTDVAGRMASLKDEAFTATAKFTVTATGTGAYTFHLMQNGQSVATVVATLSATPASATLSQSVILYPGDYLEMWVEADAHTVDLVVIAAQFEVG